MRIAIIGTGISGLTSAYLLSQKHDVVVYESADRLGGHTATIDIEYDNQPYAIDTGFIVFNDWTYPNFKKLLANIGVDYQPTDMGFSVSCEESGLEYSGTNIDTLFAQRKNIVSWRHWQMIRDIIRFNKEAPLDVNENTLPEEMTLGEYLSLNNYSKVFIDKYLIPMGAAIWSASTSTMKQFPLQFFVKFFINHGLLSVTNRPQWHVIKGGSRSYIEPLTQTFKQHIRLNSPVVSIERTSISVEPQEISDHQQAPQYQVNVTTKAGDTEQFDHVIVACHSDQALALLADATPSEQSVLGNIAYRDNEVVLHTDDTLLPDNKKTWSSWNYRIVEGSDETPPVLTYDMNILQNINAPCTFCVTLNKTDMIDPDKILGVYHYSHPVFTVDAVSAQQRWSEVNGKNNTWFCGAYWANGFHEDGVASAVRIAECFDIHL